MSASTEAYERLTAALFSAGRAIAMTQETWDDGRNYRWETFACSTGLFTLQTIRDEATGELVLFELWRPVSNTNQVDDDIAVVLGGKR